MESHSNKRFLGKVALVTGSARGIGRNVARAFGQEGARVVICDIDEEKGKATESEFHSLGIASEFLHVDLRREGAPPAMVREVVRRQGRLDILVNNARGGERLGMLEETEETWEEGIAVTLRAAFFASQEAVRVMSQSGGGNIVNISSIMARMTCHESPVYHIAKAGMAHMTRYFATHAGVYKVRVNAILPGFIVQDEHRERYNRDDNESYREVGEFAHPMRQVGASDDIAHAALFLSSPEAEFITGQCLVVDGGATLQEQNSLLHQFSQRKKKAAR